MRKSRIRFTEIDSKILSGIVADPLRFFDDLEEFSVKVPTWSKLLLLILVPEKQGIEISFFEEAKEFFLSYTKKVLRYSDGTLSFFCFSRELSEEWKLFVPPTLIGTNLKTKLRTKKK